MSCTQLSLFKLSRDFSFFLGSRDCIKLFILHLEVTISQMREVKCQLLSVSASKRDSGNYVTFTNTRSKVSASVNGIVAIDSLKVSNSKLQRSTCKCCPLSRFQGFHVVLSLRVKRAASGIGVSNSKVILKRSLRFRAVTK